MTAKLRWLRLHPTVHKVKSVTAAISTESKLGQVKRNEVQKSSKCINSLLKEQSKQLMGEKRKT